MPPYTLDEYQARLWALDAERIAKEDFARGIRNNSKAMDTFAYDQTYEREIRLNKMLKNFNTD
jgi:hypothetical protein